MSDFKDFDQAWEEAGGDAAHPGINRKFKFAGETFEANFSPEAGEILDWMSNDNRLGQIPQVMKISLSDDEYARLRSILKEHHIMWQRLEPVITWLVEELAGTNVGKEPDSTGSSEGTEQE